jgi:hypothetical protein
MHVNSARGCDVAPHARLGAMGTGDVDGSSRM